MFSLANRHLYLCVGVRDDVATFLPAVLEGGVDVVQLREKERPRTEQVTPGREMVAICRDYGVPFVMNDDPTLALEVGADGVHVGQDDRTVAACRELLGPEAIVGLSTHADDEFLAGLEQAATYLSAGPLEATPTKVGRPGTGLAYVQRCVARADRPVFVTGGVNATNVASYVEAGLRHFVVVRALTESSDPGRSARAIRRALDEALSAVTI
ncbi:MAG TPA: thiamine phosphate synthase [Acidimicrobiales bacterium]